MAREYSRSQRVGDFLQQELAQLIQRELRDPRVELVSVTGVDVSRDLSHAKVFFTQLGVDNIDTAKPTAETLNKAAGFLRSQLARSATMRTVPRHCIFGLTKALAAAVTWKHLLLDATADRGPPQPCAK